MRDFKPSETSEINLDEKEEHLANFTNGFGAEF